MSLSLDVEAVRGEYPLLARRIAGRPVVYLDSAATALKPRAVIRAVVEFYETYTANIHRGIHQLGDEATERFEESRRTVAAFLGADAREIVFTRNCTDSLNLVAHGLQPARRALVCLGEHHSNLIPWQAGGAVELVGLLPDGRIDLTDLAERLDTRVPTVVSSATVSNALGAVQPVAEIVSAARRRDALVVLDASQSVAHQTTRVSELGADFLAFSAHKLGGPSGLGVLWGQATELARLKPHLLGGAMVDEVHASQFSLRPPPQRFEAGTPHIEGALGLAAACQFLEDLGLDAVHAHTQALTARAMERLAQVPGLRLLGPTNPAARGASVTFQLANLEAHAVARLLSNRHLICVRSGFHCAQPAHEALGAAATVRASFAHYNTPAEVDLLADALLELARTARGM